MHVLESDRGSAHFCCERLLFCKQKVWQDDTYRLSLVPDLLLPVLQVISARTRRVRIRFHFGVTLCMFDRKPPPLCPVAIPAQSGECRFYLYEVSYSSFCSLNKTNTSMLHKPNKGPFSETSSTGSGSGSLSILSEYESDWPPLTVGASSPAGGGAAHSGPAAEAGTGSPLLKLLDSRLLCTMDSTCCCFCKAAWDQRKTTLNKAIENHSKGINNKCYIVFLM